ncbi:hypothetical protein [Marivita hallyeonensis]|uniref:Uncharacterized protein n=1 Tax=Marivita hallyeonensis TaxID=996342 RepID=A0A1M5RD65_9RHOB|nr:hypothetical protein [Marivita hallyeonensis]SHH23976.1 hypothetical protein SAMN05443551_1705 [Marivita hallyeonensis]
MLLDHDQQAVIDNLRHTQGPESVVEALQKAAALTEHAAYEIARQGNGPTVAELILSAARLERISRLVAQNYGIE